MHNDTDGTTIGYSSTDAAEAEPEKSSKRSRYHNPEKEKRLEQELRPNPYDDIPREERAARFYRLHTHLNPGPNRREVRDYADAVARLLPMPKGSTPIDKATMDKLFRGKSGRVKRLEREEKKAAKQAARNKAQ